MKSATEDDLRKGMEDTEKQETDDEMPLRIHKTRNSKSKEVVSSVLRSGMIPKNLLYVKFTIKDVR